MQEWQSRLHQQHGGAARDSAEALWLANSSKQAWHCLRARSCWELEKQTLEGGKQVAMSTWETLRTEGRLPSPQSSPLLPHGDAESRDVHPNECLSLSTCSSWAEGQVWSYVHAWPDPEAPGASSMPTVSCAPDFLGTGHQPGPKSRRGSRCLPCMGS